MIREFVLWDTFREEFRKFVEYFELPMTVCEDKHWYQFLKYYAGIVEDGSLSCDTNDKLKHITQVNFSKGRDRAEGSIFPFDLRWEITMIDGRTMTVEVSVQESENGHVYSNVIDLR